MPVDPVCGIELSEELATVLEFNDKKIYFCSYKSRESSLQKDFSKKT